MNYGRRKSVWSGSLKPPHDFSAVYGPLDGRRLVEALRPIAHIVAVIALVGVMVKAALDPGCPRLMIRENACCAELELGIAAASVIRVIRLPMLGRTGCMPG